MQRQKYQDECQCCRQPLRFECPVCRRWVRVETEASELRQLASHDKAECTGSHLEWKTCPASGREVVLVPTGAYALKEKRK